MIYRWGTRLLYYAQKLYGRQDIGSNIKYTKISEDEKLVELTVFDGPLSTPRVHALTLDTVIAQLW